MTRLVDIAPRLARARDQLLADRVEQWERKQARVAAARERKRVRRENPDVVFCGKVRYPTQAEAIEGRSRAHASVRLRVYECRVCGGWHLSSKAHARWAKAGEGGAAA